MNEFAINIPLIAVALGLGITLAMGIRYRRKGRSPGELCSLVSMGCMVTAVLQSGAVLGALAILTVVTEMPLPMIDRIRWFPVEVLNSLTFLCWAFAVVALIREKRALKEAQKQALWRRYALGLVLVTAFLAALVWTQRKISDVIAEARLAIAQGESGIAFRAVVAPELVNALHSNQVRHIELTNVNGDVVGVAVNGAGNAFRWDVRTAGDTVAEPILLPGPVDVAFVMPGYFCGIARDGHASCVRNGLAAGASPVVLSVDGPTSAFLPAPVCNGHVRVCALVDNGGVRCFEETLPGAFQEQSLPLENGVRGMTPQFGCIGCFIEKSGHVRCLMQGLQGETITHDVEGIDDAVAIASSLDHGCAIGRDGRLDCWAIEASATMAHARKAWKSQRMADIHAIQVSVTQTHTCALEKSGMVYCWGSNQWGELGDGNRVDRATPAPVMDVLDATMVSVENSVTCIVRRSGEVACWGKQRRKW